VRIGSKSGARNVCSRPLADIAVNSKVETVERSWPQLRYWCALSASLAFAALTIPSGLALGGPDGPIGWFALGVLLVSPMAIWWTRWGKAAAPLQNGYLILAVLAVVSAALVASLSP